MSYFKSGSGGLTRLSRRRLKRGCMGTIGINCTCCESTKRSCLYRGLLKCLKLCIRNGIRVGCVCAVSLRSAKMGAHPSSWRCIAICGLGWNRNFANARTKSTPEAKNATERCSFKKMLVCGLHVQCAAFPGFCSCTAQCRYCRMHLSAWFCRNMRVQTPSVCFLCAPGDA